MLLGSTVECVQAARAERRPEHVLRNMNLEPHDELDAFARALEAFRVRVWELQHASDGIPVT